MNAKPIAIGQQSNSDDWLWCPKIDNFYLQLKIVAYYRSKMDKSNILPLFIYF